MGAFGATLDALEPAGGALAARDTIVDVEHALGNAGNDTLIGSALDNFLLGGGGDDRVSGGAGNDTLFSGQGTDTLDGGAGMDTADFSSVTGKGVTGNVGGRIVSLGNAAMMRDQGVTLGDLEERADELRREGATALFAAIDGKPGGVIAVADPIKASTPQAMITT